MIRRLTGAAVGVLLAACWVAAILAFAISTGTLDGLRERADRIAGSDRPPKQRPPHARPGEPGALDRVEQLGRSAAATAWRTGRLVLLAALSLALASLTCRAVYRRRRLVAMRRFEIRLGREDVASPYKREKLFDGWHGQLAARWWQRLHSGQPSFALEVHHGADATQRLVLACPKDLRPVLEGRLLETYPDVRLVELPGTPTWARHLVRLKKRRLFIDRLQTVRDDEQALCESLVQAMATLGQPATVQLVLTPGPWLLHRFARWLLKQRERDLTRSEQQRREDIGVDSVVEDKELKGALETQHRSLYVTEIRIASDSRTATRALAGAFSETRSENNLTPRHAIVRRVLYARRLALAAVNPLPSFLHGVLSSSELAAVWALPRQRAKGARLVRSPTRRAPAPPEIHREPDHALLRDERGPVGLWPEDRTLGLALIGGQKTGKTSAMARTIAVDAQDRDAALVVLDPKHDLAQHALELIPEDRRVWYMDLARPEVGIEPLGVDASPGVVADMLVAALREAHPDGSIMAASDRFLRHAAMAVCAVEPRPTLWHMLELLSPRRAEYRERVTERLAGQPEHAALLRYWGRSFPELWEDATRGQLGMALDAPRNKLERLITTVEVDKALRHPFPIDMRGVIRERQVLVVNGSLGEVGQDNAVTVMQLLIQLLHQALKQQQLLPAEQRPRVCLKVDEAHLVLTPSFAQLLALHRAAGLEVVAAWQYNAQLQDPVIRSGLRSLLRSVSMFAMGEVRDARGQAEVAMEVYTDSIKTEREDLERLRISPDDVVRLPVHTAVNSWVAQGARRSAFIATTYPMDRAGDSSRRDHHLSSQRKVGAGWPSDLPPPAEVAPAADLAPRSAVEVAQEAETAQAAGDSSEADGKSADASRRSGGRRSRAAAPAQAGASRPAAGAAAPETYSAVHREGIRGISWDEREPDPELARRLAPAPRDLEVLRALWRYRVLLTSQIAAEWWPDNDPSAAQRRLVKLTRAGWLCRFRPVVAAGTHEWIYQLTPDGNALGQRHHGPHGPYIPAGRFQQRRPTDFRLVAHDLQVNAWVMAYRRLAGRLIGDWLGPEESVVEVPQRQRGRRGERIGPDDVRPGGYVQLRGLRRREFARVSPDATLAMATDRGRRFELAVELDRTRRANKNESKLLRYDALISAWWRATDRYRELGEPPAVVFVCPSEHDAHELIGYADREVTGSLHNPGESAEHARYPGRERMLFVAEPEIHQGSGAAFMLSRAAGGKKPGGRVEARDVQLPLPPPTGDA